MEGRTIWQVYDPEVCRVIEPAFRAALAGEETTLEHAYRGLHFVVHVVPVPEDDGRILRGAAIVTDVTSQRRQDAERDRLREALFQAQKVEAIGRLAAGVAHELNNALMAVSGHAALLEEQLGRTDPVRHDVRQILASTDRAAAVTRQLLAFGRRQVLHPRILDVNEAVRSCRRLLGPLLPRRIVLETVLPERAPHTFADPGQLEQVLVNLVLNSRDAIAGPGTITIGVATLEVDAAAAPRHGVPPGEYVAITVADTGTGMDATVMERIFEPFFTTKEVGEGTGLGLATVDGIVRQEGGFVTVASEPGAGTVLTVALPRRAASDARGEQAADAVPETTGRALVVDDEHVVREICAELIADMGYVVATAVDGEEALAHLEDDGQPLDLLVTDVLMPKVDGAELAWRVAERSPGTAIVLMSGHPGDRLPDLAGRAFLQKPFGRSELVAAVEAARARAVGPV
jgi:two-component system, cell cycle sensor histidine kinase and response regulator CckA